MGWKLDCHIVASNYYNKVDGEGQDEVEFKGHEMEGKGDEKVDGEGHDEVEFEGQDEVEVESNEVEVRTKSTTFN